MKTLQNKIDFAVILTVDRANPNGDPLNGNRPRTDYDGYGEIADVCIKRKLRNRMQDAGYTPFIQSDDRSDGLPSLKHRAESEEYGLGKDIFNAKKHSGAEVMEKACAKWLDVRSFGQLFAFGKKSEDDKGAGVSIAVRGPVSVQAAFSLEPVNVTSIQIVKSTNGEGEGDKRSSDRMGMKHRVEKGVYVFFGSMNPQLAERTGFSDNDAEIIKGLLPTLFENDASSARPEGSMGVLTVIWWKHTGKLGQYSSARVHRSLTVHPDGTHTIREEDTPGLKPEIIPGF